MSLGGTAVLVSLDSSTSRVDVAVRGEVCLSLGQRPCFWRVCAYIVQEWEFVKVAAVPLLLWVGKSTGQGAATKAVQKA